MMLSWVLRGPKCAKKTSSNTIIPPPAEAPWSTDNKTEWIHAFMLFIPNSDPTIWMLQPKLRLIRSENIFQSSNVQFWWAHVNCCLSLPFVADRSGIRCDLLLLWPIWSEVLCRQRCSSAYLELVLPSYQLEATQSLAILLWPQQGIFFLRTAAHSVNIGDGCAPTTMQFKSVTHGWQSCCHVIASKSNWTAVPNEVALQCNTATVYLPLHGYLIISIVISISSLLL